VQRIDPIRKPDAQTSAQTKYFDAELSTFISATTLGSGVTNTTGRDTAESC
jgi:hypothetical protein